MELEKFIKGDENLTHVWILSNWNHKPALNKLSMLFEGFIKQPLIHPCYIFAGLVHFTVRCFTVHYESEPSILLWKTFLFGFFEML